MEGDWCEPACLDSHIARISAMVGRAGGSTLSVSSSGSEGHLVRWMRRGAWSGMADGGCECPCLASHIARISATVGRGENSAASISSSGSASRSGPVGVPARIKSLAGVALVSRGWGSYLALTSGKRFTIVRVKRSTSAGSSEPTSARQTVPRSTTRCTRFSNALVCVALKADREYLATCLPCPVSALVGSQRPTQGDSTRWAHCAFAVMERAIWPAPSGSPWAGWSFVIRRASRSVLISPYTAVQPVISSPWWTIFRVSIATWLLSVLRSGPAHSIG